MTIVTNWYTMDNKEGVDLNNPQTISTTSNPDYPAPSAKLGDRVQGNNGSEWIFVQASTTVTANNIIAIDNTFKANTATLAAVASNNFSLGVAEFQASAAQPSDFFWALLKANGGVAVNVSPSVGRGVPVYLQANTGQITSSASTNRLNNVMVVASIGTSASGPAEVSIFSYIQPSQNFSSSA